MTRKKHFKGLNELRAIAAFGVVFHHIELFKFRDKIPSLYGYSEYFIDHLGKNAVHLFFILSGFLITYLLLYEKHQFKTVYLRKFYIRRILRIWPLYYSVMIISFFLIPFLVDNIRVFEASPYYYNLITDSTNYNWESKFLYLTFLPNFALNLGFSVPGASQSWSIGVEEQFYFIWPLLVLFFNKRSLPYVLCIFVIWPFLEDIDFGISNFDLLIDFVVNSIPFHFLAIGSLGAFVFFYQNPKIEKISNFKFINILILVMITFLISVPLINLFYQQLILGILFMLLIFVIIDDNKRNNLRNDQLSSLGKISFGIYMYHPFIMFLVFPILNFYRPDSIILYNFLAYFFIISLTILISNFSYHFLEEKFIKIKNTRYKLVK